MPKLAICGGKPVREKPWPAWPIVGEQEERAIIEVLRSGRWGRVMSPEDRATQLERSFAEYHQVGYAVTVTNGSVALEIALRTAKIGSGDEVITPPTTWVATNLAPVMVGADPVFVDVEPETYCLDPERIEEAITPRTKAIIPVHLGGYLCQMDRIMEIARKHHLLVIEDCAQAHGGRYEGSVVGSIGDFGCFSFEISKLMTAGEGGMVTTDNPEYGEYANGLAHASWRYGNQPGGYFPENGRAIAWNARMTEFQAALLTLQLARLEEQRQKRVRNAEYLKEQLSQIEGIKPLRQSPEQNYYSYIFKYEAACFKDVPVAKFRDTLTAEGMSVFSSASHQHPAYRSPCFYSPRRDYKDVFCPIAEKAFEEEAVGLRATWVLLGDRQDMDDIVEAVAKIEENAEELRD